MSAIKSIPWCNFQNFIMNLPLTESWKQSRVVLSDSNVNGSHHYAPCCAWDSVVAHLGCTLDPISAQALRYIFRTVPRSFKLPIAASKCAAASFLESSSLLLPENQDTRQMPSRVTLPLLRKGLQVDVTTTPSMIQLNGWLYAHSKSHAKSKFWLLNAEAWQATNR